MNLYKKKYSYTAILHCYWRMRENFAKFARIVSSCKLLAMKQILLVAPYLIIHNIRSRKLLTTNQIMTEESWNRVAANKSWLLCVGCNNSLPVYSLSKKRVRPVNMGCLLLHGNDSTSDTCTFRGPCTPILWFVFPIGLMRLITVRYFCHFIKVRLIHKLW
jgi:hypothetical protein